MADTRVAKRNEDKNVQAREETRADERYIKPAVDIIETEDGLTMIADIPGASKKTMDISVDKGILTLNAPVSHSMPGRPIYTEFEFAHYYRQFSVPETLDHQKAKADFSNGVLTLKVPVAETAKPRKIEIKAG
ncbi:MAG: Hsp20/alpha crystallin family protein [Desulfuromonadaceae bacterium]|nr:Hsp20/alpha crystallin family protein [Desulfuromonadaceae bacterium]